MVHLTVTVNKFTYGRTVHKEQQIYEQHRATGFFIQYKHMQLLTQIPMFSGK